MNRKEEKNLENATNDFYLAFYQKHQRHATNDEVDNFMEAKLKDWNVYYDYGAGERMMALLWMRQQSGFLESFRSLTKK